MTNKKPEINNNINREIKNWIRNVMRFYYQRSIGNIITKRNPKLWVFSSWEGTKYADNARYLFEYINTHNDKGIRCVWITKNEDALKTVHSLGYEGYLIGTKESKEIQKQAGAALRTHGIDDFGDFPYIFGAFNVHVCHGVGGNKKVYYSLDKGSFLKRFLSVAKAKIFNYAYRDATIVTSAFCASTVKPDMLSNKPTPIIGLARNDFIKNAITNLSEVFSDDFIDRHNLSLNNKYITYMPTYRPYKKSQAQLESIISDIVSDRNLQFLLEENKAKLIVKLHYATDASKMHFSDSVLLLKDKDVFDTAKLLRLSNLLITDYSSCAMDFSLKQKDVIFYAPDLEDYEKETGMYREFSDYLFKYRVSTVQELTDRIQYAIKTDFAATEGTHALNLLFNERFSDVGNFRKLTYEYVCDQLKV